MSIDQLSTWAKNVSPSPTLAVDAKAKALIASGQDICSFGAGEPDFDTPPFIKEACIQALKEGKTKYSPTAGIPPLRTALAEKYVENNKIQGVEAKNVVVSAGGKYSCYVAILATCSPGDEVIIPAPYWVSYPEMVKLAGATPKIILAGDESGFKITPEQLESAITPKSKLFILNSPSNPTGAVYTPAEIEKLVEVAMRHKLLILSDEIYEYLLYDGVKHLSPASLNAEVANSTITVSGFSKTFSMTGWRLGTLVANATIAQAVETLQSQITSNATTFAQYGALAALKNKAEAQQALTEMLTSFDRRRLKMYEFLKKIEGIKCLRAQGAFYLFPNISRFGMKSTEFAGKLLEEAKVAVVPGIAFGTDDYIRLSYATSDAIIERGLERIQSFCQKTLPVATY